MPTDISVIVPVYNEEESLPALWQELNAALGPLNKRYEVVLVDDGSTDGSTQWIKDLQARCPDTAAPVFLKQRAGQTAALAAGLQKARGQIVVTLDADLQNDPADIPYLLLKLQGGYDLACGWRRDRQDTRLKTGLSKAANAVQRLVTGLEIHDVSCTLRAYKRHCVPDIPLGREGLHRFIPLCLTLQGYRAGEVLAHHRARQYGVSKYSHGRVFKVVWDFVVILIKRGRP